ncbi:MAG TPA: hypothetical protein VLB76_02555 [Thermoanaerobaculia bacterium]|jgi:hypothetical protein|nr:hypothetical protein [Thermoanaerobaculia bacterium]
MNDERLRQRLREGDPATGENGLNPGEIHAMRRAVLAAAPEPRRRLLPALALAGAAAAILIALFALRPGPVQPPAPPRIAAVPAQPQVPAPPALQQASAPRTEPPAPGEKKKRPIQRRRHLRAAREETATLASREPAGNPPAEPGARQIQFSTPGGTRIIWTLTSGKASR